MKLALALLLAVLTVVLVLQRTGDPVTDSVSATDAGQATRTPLPAVELEGAEVPDPGGDQAARTDRVAAGAAAPDAVTSEGPGVLEVHVVDEDLAGMAAVHVVLSLERVVEEPAAGATPEHGLQRPLQAETDAEGHARLEVPPGRKGTLRALVFTGVAHMVPRELEPFEAGETRAITLELRTRADLEVSGVVVAAEDGMPVPEIRVHTIPWRGIHRSREPMPLEVDDPPAGITDGSGGFRVPAHSWAPALATFTGAGWSPTRARLGDQEEGVVVRLRRSGRLAGFVTCSKPGALIVRAITPGHHLIAGPDAVSMSPGETCFDAEVAADGSFRLEDLPSRVPLRLQVLLAGAREYEHPDPVTLEPDETRDFEWDLGRGGAISGHVRTPAGAPSAAQEVWLLPAAQAGGTMLRRYDQALATVRSDEHGAFRFEDVQPGGWTVGLAPARGGDGVVAPMAKQLEVPLAGGEVRVDLVVHRGLFLEGRVLDPEGEPTRAYVMTFGGPNSVEHDIDDPQQGFRLGPLVPGSYQVFAMPSTRSEWSDAEPIRATVTEEGGESGLVLRLRSGTSISGRIVDADGEPVRARAYLAQSEDRLTIYSPQEGTFAFTGLPPGVYHLAVVTDDGRIGWREGIVVTAGQPQDDLELVVQQGAWVTLRHGGEETHVSYRIQRGGVVFAADGLHGGTEARVCVPTGHLELLVNGEARELVVHADQEMVVEL